MLSARHRADGVRHRRARGTGLFQTIFLACFAVGLGTGSAFMPLLTLHDGRRSAADAGLGLGITNVAHQIGSAFGLAVLEHDQPPMAKRRDWVADRRRPHRVADQRIPTHIPDGAATITDIVLGFVLLRPRRPRPELQLAEAQARTTPVHVLEEQAA